MVDEEGKLLALNDTFEDTELSFTVRDLFAQDVVMTGKGLAAADAVSVLAQLPIREQALYHITFTHKGGEGSNHYLMGKPAFSLQALKAALPIIFPDYALEV